MARDSDTEFFGRHVRACEGSNEGQASTIEQIGGERSQWYLYNHYRGKIHGGNDKAMVFCSVRLLNGGGCRSWTRDDDWKTLEIQRWMAIVAAVTAEATVNLE